MLISCIRLNESIIGFRGGENAVILRVWHCSSIKMFKCISNADSWLILRAYGYLANQLSRDLTRFYKNIDWTRLDDASANIKKTTLLSKVECSLQMYHSALVQLFLEMENNRFSFFSSSFSDGFLINTNTVCWAKRINKGLMPKKQWHKESKIRTICFTEILTKTEKRNVGYLFSFSEELHFCALVVLLPYGSPDKRRFLKGKLCFMFSFFFLSGIWDKIFSRVVHRRRRRHQRPVIPNWNRIRISSARKAVRRRYRCRVWRNPNSPCFYRSFRWG